jgi:hypothetical protein
LVSTTEDAGPGSLRQAILDANANPGSNTIAFNIGDGGVQTVQPRSALPAVTNPVILDGTTQPGFAGSPLIVLNGSRAGQFVNGLTITAGNSTVSGLVINGFSRMGIELAGSGGNVIAGNFIGTDVTGTVLVSNDFDGVEVHAPNNTIGGVAAGGGNVISGNGGDGVALFERGNVIQGNFLGTDVTGTQVLPNYHGVDLFSGADNTIIGGTASGAGNLISGNRQNGINTSGAVRGLQVQGNLIGTDVTGATTLRNGGTGVSLSSGSTNNTVGGTAAGAGNVISGNSGPGISLLGLGTTGNLVQGNFIGTDVTGTQPLGNDSGIFLSFSSGNMIGGAAAGAGNIISGNRTNGVEILRSSGNLLQGNFIGTDKTGRTAVANGHSGVDLDFNAPVNTVGGIIPGASNVISGNRVYGIEIHDSGNVVQGNLIGTNLTGTAAVANGTGVYIFSGSSTIGGTAAAARNLISGNTADGVFIEVFGDSANRVQGNFIGTDLSGRFALGNGRDGVRVFSLNTVVGGTMAGAGNLISGNGGDGVDLLSGGAGAQVQGNFIGTDVTGNFALGNRSGVSVGGSNHTIGGTAAGAGNLISGNRVDGISLSGTGTLVQSNFIGTTSRGTVALANGGNGVAISSGAHTIGGLVLGVGNLISGNQGSGIAINSNGNRVEGNRIGTDITGTRAVGNLNGVAVRGSNNVIGGTAAGARNILAGSSENGIALDGNGNTVQGNLIGTDATGTAALGNNIGITVSGSNNVIGGTAAEARNVISGNRYVGLFLFNNATGSVVWGNYIGTDITGMAALPNISGVSVSSSAGATVGGTAPGASNLISGNSDTGILITGRDVHIEGNRIGTNATGTAALGNRIGVFIGFTSVNALIGGTATGAGNLISGNGGGIGVAAAGATIQGNRIGTDATGTRAVPNGTGVYTSGPNNTIGGTAAGAGNLISGNSIDGIQLGSAGNVVQGNWIGTDVTGTNALANRDGVEVYYASNNTIGGAMPGAGNLISGNTYSGVIIRLYYGLTGNHVQGNFIGTDAAGAAAVANGYYGVIVDTAAGGTTTLIGGATPGAGNLISGNGFYGILVLEGGGNAIVQGNFVGTDATGTVALGNGTGVAVGSDSTIGGLEPGAGNLISGNRGIGLAIGANNVVQGNRIGTDSSGSQSLANATGVSCGSNNTIGGMTAGAGNIISGNTGHGVLIMGNGNLVAGNYIGIDATATAALGNGGNGVFVAGGSNNTIGAVTTGLGNIIAFNSNDGVLVDRGTGNAIRRNSIFASGRLGIELTNNGNNNQPFPVVTSAISGGGVLTIQGTLTSTPNTTFTIEFFANTVCNPSGFGEGERFLGATTVTTNASGTASFMVTFAIAIDPGQFIATTATDPNNNTSQFSRCVEVTSGGGAGGAGGNTPFITANNSPIWANRTTAALDENAGGLSSDQIPVLPISPGSKPPPGERFLPNLGFLRHGIDLIFGKLGKELLWDRQDLGFLLTHTLEQPLRGGSDWAFLLAL